MISGGRERNRGWASDPSYGPNHEWEDLHEFKFLPSHIKTLEFDLHIHARYREIYYSILDYFFARSEVGVLTQYLVRASRNEWTGPNSFIEPADTPHSLRGALLAVPSAHLEELLLHASIVRVSGLCPHRKSKAYCGLVELFIDQGIPDILESQLVNILRSSPKLQVLHIKASLDEFIGGGNIQPIYLKDLTDIDLTIQFDWELSVRCILRWITPGSNPLRFAYLGTPDDSLMDLLSRRNVSRFYMAGWKPYSLRRVLSKSPCLKTLVLDAVGFTITSLSSLLDIDNLDEDDSDEEIQIALDRVSPRLLKFSLCIYYGLRASDSRSFRQR